MHTPGPWTAWKNEHRWAVSSSGGRVADVSGPDDARLIAATPDLLEALEREHPKSSHMGFGPIGRTETGSYIHGMIDYGEGCSTCALIAKARGVAKAPPAEAEGASR